jgi:threonine dehydratase
VTLTDIEHAAQAITGHVVRTPCIVSRTLSELVGAEVSLKFENLQYTASFKERGALYKLLSLDAVQRTRGIVAVSAGNHAQGVAYHAQRLAIPATIVMPRATPLKKVENTRHFGANVELAGETLEDAQARGLALAQERGYVLIHPYDDPWIIAGQGTVGLELIEQQPALDAVLVAVGGGGLISGIAAAIKQRRPGVEIIGVQTENFPHMVNTVKRLAHPGASYTIAEGIAVKAAGAITTELIRRYVDDLLLVSEGEIEQAVLLLLEIEKTLVEGAGAAPLAAAQKYKNRFRGKRVALVLSGGNLDALVLADIIKRGMVRAGRLARIRVDIRDVPGALAAVTRIVADANANIEDVVHQRAFSLLPPKNAELDMVVQTRNAEHVNEVIHALAASGFHAYVPQR